MTNNQSMLVLMKHWPDRHLITHVDFTNRVGVIFVTWDNIEFQVGLSTLYVSEIHDHWVTWTNLSKTLTTLFRKMATSELGIQFDDSLPLATVQ